MHQAVEAVIFHAGVSPQAALIDQVDGGAAVRVDAVGIVHVVSAVGAVVEGDGAQAGKDASGADRLVGLGIVAYVIGLEVVVVKGRPTAPIVQVPADLRPAHKEPAAAAQESTHQGLLCTVEGIVGGGFFAQNPVHRAIVRQGHIADDDGLV